MAPNRTMRAVGLYKPNDPDGEEADHVRDVGRPDAHQARPHIRLPGTNLGVHVEDQQRRGDRELAVGERLQPSRAHPLYDRLPAAIASP
jgi:hypothetical protein